MTVESLGYVLLQSNNKEISHNKESLWGAMAKRLKY